MLLISFLIRFITLNSEVPLHMCEWCCENCFKEKNIVDFIIDSRDVGNCDYCKSKEVYVASLAIVGDFIREGISREYEPIDSYNSRYDPEEQGFNRYGDSIVEILISTEDIFSDDLPYETQVKLVEDLLDASGSYGSDSDYDWIKNEELVEQNVLFKQETSSEYQSWEMFKKVCKFHNRYFDLLGGNYRKNSMLKALSLIFRKLTVYLPAGTTMYRVREWDTSKEQQLQGEALLRELSPAPPKYTQNNRMSPVGISYMYLGNDVKTCIQEVRSRGVFQQYLVGEYLTRKKLKLLDTTQVPSLESPSCFSEEFDISKKWVSHFVRDFEEEISQPLDEDRKTLEYVATQVLAEYIRKIGYNGISYKSSYNKDKVNYVLFCTINEDISSPGVDCSIYSLKGILQPFTKWLKLQCAKIYTIDLVPTLSKTIPFDDENEKYHDKEEEHKRFQRRMSKKFRMMTASIKEEDAF